MSELEKQRKITNDIIEKKLTDSEKQLIEIYKNAFTSIKSDLVDLNNKSDWTITELRKYDRLSKVQNQILDEIKKLSKNTYDEIKNTDSDVVWEQYQRSNFGIIKEVKVLLDFQHLNAEQIKAIVEMPYPNIPLKDFINRIGATTFEKIKIILGTNLAVGNSFSEIATKIKDTLGISFNQALRIARTEGLRSSSKAQLESTDQATALGLDIQKIWNSTLDLRTRLDHRKLDGQVADKNGFFYVSGYKAQAPRMFGVAREDINCRCSYTEKIVDISEPIKKRFDNETKKLIDNITYDEWFEKYRIKS
jgi:uncharacterized protein with gpF-like domain